jgi:hypothetical protein
LSSARGEAARPYFYSEAGLVETAVDHKLRVYRRIGLNSASQIDGKLNAIYRQASCDDDQRFLAAPRIVTVQDKFAPSAFHVSLGIHSPADFCRPGVCLP